MAKKVEIPSFVARAIKKYDSMLSLLANEYFDPYDEAPDDKLVEWIDEGNQYVLARAYMYGYTIKRQFKVIGDTRYDHGFTIGDTVYLEKVYPDGVYAVRGNSRYSLRTGTLDVHPCDLEEITQEEE